MLSIPSPAFTTALRRPAANKLPTRVAHHNHVRHHGLEISDMSRGLAFRDQSFRRRSR
jgi:hypothetical protein